MRIIGTWHTCDDGVVRPVLRGLLFDAHGKPLTEWFLIDTGADQTVLSGAVYFRLGTPGRRPEGSQRVTGIGGSSEIVLVPGEAAFTRDDGQLVKIRGEIAAFTDPAATDFSVLGRDVLDNFDLVVSRRRDQIWMLAGGHGYRIESA
jgi:hypothetical protein